MELQTFVILLIGIFAINGASARVVEIPCTFVQMDRGYTCRLPDINTDLYDDFRIISGTHLPGLTNANVINFLSINNHFSYVPTDVFMMFPNLRHVKISGSFIFTINSYQFENATLIESLIMSNNHIDTVEQNTFTRLTNLQELSLRFNRIRNLNGTIFSPLVNLRTIDLAFNLLERLPANLFTTNTQITNIDMTGNRITFMGAGIFNTLNLLTTVEFLSNLCHSASFINLNIPANRNAMLQALSQCFIQGPLDFRCQFSFEWVNMVSHYVCTMRDVDLYDTARVVAITGFHIQGQSNTDVTSVHVTGGNMQFIMPQIFTTFVNLQLLDLTACNLLRIQPNAFTGALSLRELSLYENPIAELEANVFQQLTNLQVLTFVMNTRLNTINENAFTGLTNLRGLMLMNSPITQFPLNLFRPLVNLIQLEAASNQLTTLNSNWFTTNTFLVAINMDYNRINSITSTFLEDLPNVVFISLLQNICVNQAFQITAETRETVRAQLATCFGNVGTEINRYILDVEGEFVLYYNNGTQVIRV